MRRCCQANHRQAKAAQSRRSQGLLTVEEDQALMPLFTMLEQYLGSKKMSLLLTCQSLTIKKAFRWLRFCY